MQEFKLANILLDLSWQYHKAPTLYCRLDGNRAVLEPASDDNSTHKLKGPGIFDFTTFFNGLSVFKWRRYSSVEKFYLHIELKGGAAKLLQTWADSYTYYPNVLDDTLKNIEPSDDWQALDIELDASSTEVIHAFRLEVESETFIRNTYYYTEVDETSLRDVELALCTTTFKKEEYIERNINIIKTRLLESGEDVANHFNMHVVDNGRTLNVSDLEDDHITIYPSPNSGGAGGFARGMIAALEQTPKATHMLLMDDDVRMSAESIIRTYQLLRVVNDEYKDAFVSGAMMNMDEPEVRPDDVDFMDTDGRCRAVKPWARMSILHDAVLNEAFTIPESISNRPDIYEHSYAAWWYCVVPTTLVEKNGLPLPVFVRCDDIEYGLRCHPKFMTMNGICVWHEPFHMRYSATAERYQTVRNMLASRFTTHMEAFAGFETEFKHLVRTDIRRFNYVDVELSLQGFEDFLKGPSFFAKPGQVEERFLWAMKNHKKFQTFEEAYDEVKALGVDLNKLSACDVLKLPPLETHNRISERIKQRFVFEQLSGQRFAKSNYFRADEPAIIDGKGHYSYDTDLKVNNHKVVVGVDVERKTVTVCKYDQERFNTLWKRYKDDLKEYQENKERLQQEYRAAKDTLTSVAFWKAYLGLDGRKCDERGYGIIGPDEFGGLVKANER